MSDAVDIWEKPEAEEIYMIVGWRQWADAGSVSSGLPQYLIKQVKARLIGKIRADGFYLFQFPGTHDLVRPVVKFEEGHPVLLQRPQNELFYQGDEKRGVIFLIGDEPHLNIEAYVDAVLDIAETFNVKRIIGFGGVYGELPYNKERTISCVFSLPGMKDEIKKYAVDLSDYHGGASIGSYLCKRSEERDIEHVTFYAFVPTYDFSEIAQIGNTVRIENDFMAWLGIMRRVNYMLKIEFDLSELEEKSDQLIDLMDEKVKELDSAASQLGVLDYMESLAEEYTEQQFNPLEEVWEEELRRLFNKLDSDETD
jgi:proteasome assembly chaperone (PAC2) family protein